MNIISKKLDSALLRDMYSSRSHFYDDFVQIDDFFEANLASLTLDAIRSADFDRYQFGMNENSC